jgi:exodeoxyribonuclease VII large subunit
MIPTTHPHLRLSELASKLEAALREHFANDTFWVVGEISGHKFYPAQARHYFEFVEKAEGHHDPIAKFRGIAWAAGSESIRQFEAATQQQFTNGIQVLARVKIEYHAVHSLSLVLQEVDQFYTLGNLERQRMDILLRLVNDNPGYVEKRGEDYFTKNQSLKFGKAIQSLAVIGSPNSEGFVDFIHTLESNRFSYKFQKDIFQTTVQGPFAEAELVQTMVAVFETGKKYDAVVIIRGGGAKTDFLVFDTYRLARAVARFPIPVITGIGHHKDVSITDLMAHTATKTPTKAAEFIISHNRSFEDELLSIQKNSIIHAQHLLADSRAAINRRKLQLVETVGQLIADHKKELSTKREDIQNASQQFLNDQKMLLQVKLRQFTTQPKLMTQSRSAQLQALTEKVKSSARFFLLREQDSFKHYESVVKLMHPDNVLKKGFAILSQNGRIIANDDDIKEGEDLEITSEHYHLLTSIKQKTKR